MRSLFGTIASARVQSGNLGPYLVEQGTALVMSGGRTSATPTIPTSVATGALVLMFAHADNATTISAPAGQGWTKYSAQHSGPSFKCEVYAKIWGIGDTDDTTPTFTYAFNGANETWLPTVWRDDTGDWANVADAVAASATDNAIASGSSPAAPSATDNGSHRTVVRVWASGDSSADFTSPSAGSLLYGTDGLGVSAATDITVTTNTGTATISMSAGPDTAAAITLSLKLHT